MVSVSCLVFIYLKLIVNLSGSNQSSNNNRPQKKQKLNNNFTNHNNVTNNSDNDNNSNNLRRHDLDREIDQFIPLVIDILEGECFACRKDIVSNICN